MQGKKNVFLSKIQTKNYTIQTKRKPICATKKPTPHRIVYQLQKVDTKNIIGD